MIFFVVGPTGVGKTYYSERMKKKFGIPYYDTGPLLRSEFKKLNLDMSFKEWIEQNEIKTNGTFAMEFIAKSISELIDLSVDNIIIGNTIIVKNIPIIKPPFINYIELYSITVHFVNNFYGFMHDRINILYINLQDPYIVSL